MPRGHCFVLSACQKETEASCVLPMYIYIYIVMYVHTHIRVYICISLSLYIYIYIYIHRSPALTVWRARLCLTASREAVTMDTPEKIRGFGLIIFLSSGGQSPRDRGKSSRLLDPETVDYADSYHVEWAVPHGCHRWRGGMCDHYCYCWYNSVCK